MLLELQMTSEADPILTLRREIRACRGCHLGASTFGPVPPEIPTDLLARAARTLCLGDASGRQEDRAVQPFIGPAGTLARDWVREAAPGAPGPVWANVVSCFPGGMPTLEQVKACDGNLAATLELTKPTHILCFGAVALGAMQRVADLARGKKGPWLVSGVISVDRGKWWWYPNDWGGSYCFATWHPSAVLRNRALREQAEAEVSEFMFYAIGKFAPEVKEGPPPTRGVRV